MPYLPCTLKQSRVNTNMQNTFSFPSILDRNNTSKECISEFLTDKRLETSFCPATSNQNDDPSCSIQKGSDEKENVPRNAMYSMFAAVGYTQDLGSAGGQWKNVDSFKEADIYSARVMPMQHTEKKELVHKLTMLPSQYLLGILNIIQRYEAEALLQIEKDTYAFDMANMNESTVWAVHDYVTHSLTRLDSYKKRNSSATPLAASCHASNIKVFGSSNVNMHVDSNRAAYALDIMKEKQIRDEFGTARGATYSAQYFESSNSNKHNAASEASALRTLEKEASAALSAKLDTTNTSATIQENYIENQTKVTQQLCTMRHHHFVPLPLAMNNQEKFLQQVQLYSRPKIPKSRVKPSRKHECPTCNKQFRGRSELQNHIRTHTGEKPLKCSYKGCGKRYAHSSNLRAHERTHAGVKPYACYYDGCGKRFAHSVSLKEHIWMHAGLQPYRCPYEGCGKRFTQVSNFARHKKTHERDLTQR